MNRRDTPTELAEIQTPEVEEEQVQTIDNLDDVISYVMPNLKEMWGIIIKLNIFPSSYEMSSWTLHYKLVEEDENPTSLSELKEILESIQRFVSNLSRDRLKEFHPEMQILVQRLDESISVIKTILKKNPYSQRVFQVVPDLE